MRVQKEGRRRRGGERKVRKGGGAGAAAAAIVMSSSKLSLVDPTQRNLKAAGEARPGEQTPIDN